MVVHLIDTSLQRLPAGVAVGMNRWYRTDCRTSAIISNKTRLLSTSYCKSTRLAVVPTALWHHAATSGNKTVALHTVAALFYFINHWNITSTSNKCTYLSLNTQRYLLHPNTDLHIQATIYNNNYTTSTVWNNFNASGTKMIRN